MPWAFSRGILPKTEGILRFTGDPYRCDPVLAGSAQQIIVHHWLAEVPGERDAVFHVLIAADVTENNIRVVTAYVPDPDKWREDFRMRRPTP